MSLMYESGLESETKGSLFAQRYKMGGKLFTYKISTSKKKRDCTTRRHAAGPSVYT